MTAVPTLTDVITEAVGPLERYANKCHGASLALVQSGVLPEYLGIDPERFSGHAPRVARGSCEGVGGQHSWVVMGDNVYDRTALIIDITLWSYDPTAEQVWVGNMAEERRHTPFGSRSIWQWGKPQHAGGVTIPLETEHLSDAADDFMGMVGPLDHLGWGALWGSGAMQGWPAAEILDAFLEQHPTLQALIPVDIVAHLTDRNPGNLYW